MTHLRIFQNSEIINSDNTWIYYGYPGRKGALRFIVCY